MAWQQQQQPQVAANQFDITLVVSGCQHATVGAIARGSFGLAGENHGKPTYKKDAQVNGLDVMMYFWDERDGAGFCGWWFGPKVGGDQVWAYHPDKTSTVPPQTGWKVPYDGAVDTTFAIAYHPKGQQQQQQPQQQQQQQQQPQQQQQWAQQGWQQQGQQQQQQQQQQQGWGNQQNSQQSKLEEMKQKQMAYQQQNPGKGGAKGGGKAGGGWQQDQAQNRQLQEQRMAEQRQKMEQMKAQQQELVKKRAEEQAAKQAEIAERQKEQAAMLLIRRAMHVYKQSLPANLEANKTKLDEAVAAEVEKTGAQKEVLKTEIEQAVKDTLEKMEKIEEAKKEALKKQEEEMQRRRDLKTKADALLVELEKLVENSEEAGKGVATKSEPLTGENATDMTIAKIDACADAVMNAAKEANNVCQTCTEFVLKESPQIKNTPLVTGEAPATCTADLMKLSNRLSDAKKFIASTMSKTSVAKATKTKRTNAKAKQEKGLTAFKKFDSDKDGKLSRKELQAFSKGEYGFTLTADTLDTMCNVLVKEGEKGVDKSEFYRIKMMIGVAREAAIDAKKKKAREDREAEIAALKEKLTATIQKVTDQGAAATEAVAAVDKEVQAVAGKKDMKAVEMVAKATEIDAAIEQAKTSVTGVKEAITSVKTAEIEAELKSFLNNEVRKLESTLKTLEASIARIATKSAKFTADAKKKDHEELEKLRKQGLAMIHHHQSAKKLMIGGVFKEFESKKKAGAVQETSFVKFFSACEKKEGDAISEEDASRLFNFLDTDDQGFLPEDQFLNFIRKFMKVVKASVLSEEASVKSTLKRRLEEGEVVEVLTGENITEDDTELHRLRVKAMNDDAEGWCTPVGNQGSVFLEEGGNLFKVVKDTILTGSFVIGEDTKIKDRKLKVGTIVEVHEWPKKEEGSGLMRMKAAVKGDGQVGYATSVGNTGIVFLECL